MKSINKFFIPILFSIILIQSCKFKEDFNHIKSGAWHPNLIIPLVDTKMSLERVVNSVLNYEDSVSLGRIANYFPPSTKNTIYSLNGTKGNFPPVSSQPAGTYNLYNSSKFDEMSFADGILILKIKNNFSVPIKPLKITLINNNGSVTIGKLQFPFIAPYSTGVDSISLAGVTLSSTLSFSIDSIGTPGGNNVMIDTTQKITASISCKNIAVYSGEFQDLNITQTITQDNSLFDNYYYANFKMHTINNFPFSFALQVYFFNDTSELFVDAAQQIPVPYKVLDSLFTDTLFKAPNVDPNGKVIEPQSNLLWVPFTQERYEKISGTKSMVMRVSIKTVPPNKPVLFYSDYYLGVQLGMQTNLQLN